MAYEYPNYPVGFPNATMPDPLAILIGGNVGLGLQNNGVNMGISINNTKDLLNLTGSVFKDPANTATYIGKRNWHMCVKSSDKQINLEML